MNDNVEKVRIDQTKCIGSGRCVLAAPKVFDQRESDGVGIVLLPNPPSSLLEGVRDAVYYCPAQAVALDE